MARALCARAVYGLGPDGQVVEEITLINDAGWCCKVLTLGGIISELHLPDRNGKLEDVVLCYDNLDDLLRPKSWYYFGCIVGRVAGRITAGRFKIGDRDIRLEQNNGTNHLHGGRVGFDRRIWKAETCEDRSGPSVVLTYTSPDGEEGYPGQAELRVTYTLTHDGSLRIEYHGVVDSITPLSLTNHTYFNLAGTSDLSSHHLTIHTPHKIPSHDDHTLMDTIENVSGTPEDFQTGRALSEVLAMPHANHIGNYFFGKKVPIPRPMARLKEVVSGRCLEVLSTETSLQLYCGCYLEERGRKKGGGLGYPVHAGVCLEAQGYPNGVNAPQLEDILVSPESPYRQVTIFRFSVLT